MELFNYDWQDGTAGMRALAEARAGRLSAEQQGNAVLALIGLADAYNALVDAQKGEGAHQTDDNSMAARAVLVAIAQEPTP